MVLKKSILTLMIMSIFILTLFGNVVSAETPVYKSNENLELRHTIVANGSAQGVTANITIRSPNNTIIALNQPMTLTSNSNEFNYTISATDTQTLGTYNYDICAYSSIENECFSYDFEITPSGNSGGDNIVLGFLITLIVLAVLFMWVGNTINSQKWLIKSALFMTSLLIMTIAVNLGITLTFGDSLNVLMTTILVVVISTISLFFMFVLVSYIIEITNAVKNAKEQRKDEDLI